MAAPPPPPPRAAAAAAASILFGNNDVLVRVMEFLGPRHAIVGFGSTCRYLRRLSRDDSLWRAFWMARCLLLPPGDDGDDDCDDDRVCPHGAALVFRRAMMRETNSNIGDDVIVVPPLPPPPDSAAPPSLYESYVRIHTTMKLTNLRVADVGGTRLAKRGGDGDAAAVGRSSDLIPPPCTQTWPGRLSAPTALPSSVFAGGAAVVTCLNPAEAWCDDPTCDEARCGPRGCLRCYRFTPFFASSSVGIGETTRAHDTPPSFVRCSWCSVSFCDEHGGGRGEGRCGLPDRYFERRGRRGRGRERGGGGGGGRLWYECDECNLSSCPDCVSQVFPHPPDAGGCGVVTAGRACRRKVCGGCAWRVGRAKRSIAEMAAENVPDGDYYGRQRRASTPSSSSSDIVTARGVRSLRGEGGREAVEWEEYETCCSKCLRHVEFRWRELAQVQESFLGFMP